MESLASIYGHEENLSKAIAKSDSFEELLNTCGVVSTEKAVFETRVDRGHDDHEGRIDILQPTTAGIVIVEVQYGTSDSSHAKRLQNYATNFRRPAFIIWVAEKFRKEHVALFEQAKTPVLCARVLHSEEGITLKKASPINWTKQSQAKRVREAHKKYLELVKKLFKGKPSNHCYEKGFIPMHKFFGAIKYQSVSNARSRAYKDRYKRKSPKNKPIDFEANILAIIEWYLQGLPKKTHFYMLKHPSFLQTKEQWKDEMACHWMLCNLKNDHPYLDYSYLYAVDDLPIGNNKSDVYDLNHFSREHANTTRDFFDREPFYTICYNEHDSSSVCPPGYYLNEDYTEQLHKWIDNIRKNWRPGVVLKDPNIHRYYPIKGEVDT